MRQKLFSAIIGLGLMVGLSGPALADLIYDLDTNNFGIVGSVGSVRLHLIDSTHATLLYTANAGFVFGDGGTAAANVNAGSWTLSLIACNSISGICSDAGSGNMDGFGSFNQKIDSPSFGPTDRSTEVSFELTNTSGTWANEAAVLIANGSGYSVGVHFLDLSCTLAACTGFAVNGGPPREEAPEPGILGLLGIGLASLSMVGLRRRRKS